MSGHRQQAPDPADKNVGEREDAVAGREHAVSDREGATRMREQLVAAREEALAAREEAEKANGRLERLVVELREANEHLVLAAMREQAARDLAARSNRIKDEFLPMLAHELRNPLAPILGAVALLARLQTADPQLAWIHDVIKRQVGQIVHLLDDLLDLSRITTGKMFLQKRPVAVREFVEQATESGRPHIDARRQRLTIELPGDPLYVDGDPDRLAQVFSNLINNASKYTSEGGAIGVSAERHDGTVAIHVIDNGSGIGADVLPHIFDLFAQEHRSLARSQGGLGIGLTVVRDLVEMHGGTVRAHSAGPGQGSEFVVTLPLLAKEPSAGVVDTEPMPIADRELHRIVIIEDNVDSCETLRELLEMAGHQVSTAFEGSTGVKLIQETHPDIVLCDIGLPEMDGYAVIARLRENTQDAMPFMIAITGYGRSEDRMRALAAGFDRYLVKPVAPDTLLQLVSRGRQSG
jgi:two-component system, sensor histidine kinase